MKKLIALLLAAAMLLSMTACGGSAEPVETAPATTEAPTTAPTEAPTEEPTEAPTEPRVAPTDFEAVDPASLPDPIPVEDQLLSTDTKTVTLGSVEEYEDLLWSLGFTEVRLAGTHTAPARTQMDGNTVKGENADSYCEPVSLTYNDNAFRLDFTYAQQIPDGELVREEGWHMYGTKSQVMENIAPLTPGLFTEIAGVTTQTINLELAEGQTVEDALASFDFNSIDWSAMLNNQNNGENNGENTETIKDSKIVTPDYEEESVSFVPQDNPCTRVHMKKVYYPVTGNLYNYMCDPDSAGITTTGLSLNSSYTVQNTKTSTIVGYAARTMCFHYLFPAEDAAE